MIYLKRAYEKPVETDGYRVLVDRLWPRGLSKEKADIDSWLKDIAPSKELRQWFGHDPKKFSEFKQRYEKELKEDGEAILQLSKIVKNNPNVTFIYSVKDEKMNNAVVLKEVIEKLNKKS